MPTTYVPRAHKTVPCTNCEGPVKMTRKSLSGLHFCPKPECRAAKARHYQKVSKSRSETEAAAELLNLISALASGSRIHCPECGLIDALPGYKHPDGRGGACAAGLLFGYGRYADRIVAILWPKPTHEPVG